jgi:hypothetical protein
MITLNWFGGTNSNNNNIIMMLRMSEGITTKKNIKQTQWQKNKQNV